MKNLIMLLIILTHTTQAYSESLLERYLQNPSKHAQVLKDAPKSHLAFQDLARIFLESSSEWDKFETGNPECRQRYVYLEQLPDKRDLLAWRYIHTLHYGVCQ